MHEIVHDQYAVQAVQQKRSGPVPPATLKAPEVAEGRARPAIESALHRQNAVQLGRGVRHWNAPEEWHKCKKNQSHSRTGFGKNFFIAERPTGGVAIENRHQRKKSDGANGIARREICWFLASQRGNLGDGCYLDCAEMQRFIRQPAANATSFPYCSSSGTTSREEGKTLRPGRRSERTGQDLSARRPNDWTHACQKSMHKNK